MSRLHDWTGRMQEMAERKDPLSIFAPGFSGDVNDLRCECSDLFSEHEKPPQSVSWDVCSFPCLKCQCQEFTEASTLQEQEAS